MLTSQRQQIICDEIAATGQVASGALAVRFDVSEDTIRRDLRTLAKAGRCRRVYGGAVAPYAGPMAVRRQYQTEEKAALARAAVTLLSPGQTVFIDAGSTTAAIATAIPETMPLTVATNSMDVAAALAARPDVTLEVLGGQLDRETGAYVGPGTVDAVGRFSADVVFLGSCGLDAERGITAFDPADVAVKQAMVASSARVIVAATTDKLGTAAPYRVVGPEAITDLIVRADAEERTAPFAALNLTVHSA